MDFLDPRGAPIVRRYMGGARAMKMIAQYDDYNEDFRVDLWEEEEGFILHLDHEYNYLLDSEQREALVASISRYERDRFLDGYYSLFGPLDHFVRATEQPRGDTAAAGNLTSAPYLRPPAAAFEWLYRRVRKHTSLPRTSPIRVRVQN